MRGSRRLFFSRSDFLQHEVGKLNKEDLLRKDEIEVVERNPGGNDVEGVDGQAEVGAIGQRDDIRRRGKIASKL